MYELIDYAGEKVTKYRDIAPCTGTLKLLRSGKLRREKKRARHIGGEAQVLTAKLVNEGLQRIEEEEEQKLYKQQLVEAKKHRAEKRKILHHQQKKICALDFWSGQPRLCTPRSSSPMHSAMSRLATPVPTSLAL